MKSNKILTIIILLLIISILVLFISFETQKKPIDNNSINITKVTIPKINIEKEAIESKEKERDELYQTLSDLKNNMEKDKNSQEYKPTENEAQNILSSLKTLQPEKINKEIIVKEKIEKKLPIKKTRKRNTPKKSTIKKPTVKKKDNHKKKKTIKNPVKKKNIAKKVTPIPKPKEIIIYKEIFIEKPISKPSQTITAKEYRKRLKESEPVDLDLMSLPMVETVDMDIEEKIKTGKTKELTTQKPLVEEKTIHIPSSEKKIDDSIPWANLIEIDEHIN